ncbi:YkgJ family cysteine cluster protein [Chitinimonas sp. BJYL2]|uniref:YkgJ family cysteine cluster protein n=1 Tax=Chitinimonas sp. BJYL2 TaxID=2976696 RepID=UPI0022B38F88|nr:YkgJ family cysteine cluster protein [Chitinimonas sp. BJYL2]
MQERAALHPCQHCGACCNSFRVSFYWAEAEVNAIPASLTDKVNDFYLCMRGTHARAPACAAHRGTVGVSSACSIYAHRPSPCREVQPGDPQCTLARQRHSLPPITFLAESHHV